MEMKEVVSSNIHSVGFELGESAVGEPKVGTLQVKFTQGGLYRYYAVPQEVYEGMMASESKGKYLNANVSKKFKYERVTEQQKPIEKTIDKEGPING